MRGDTVQMSHQTCRQCGHVFFFQDEREGQTLRCPDCREATRLRVPDTPTESVCNAGTAVLAMFAGIIAVKVLGLGFLLLAFLVGWPALLVGGLIVGGSVLVNSFKSDKPKPPKRKTNRTRIVECESVTSASRRAIAADTPATDAAAPSRPQDMYRFECSTCWTENVMTEAKRIRIAGKKFACRECGKVKRIPYPTLEHAD